MYCSPTSDMVDQVAFSFVVQYKYATTFAVLHRLKIITCSEYMQCLRCQLIANILFLRVTTWSQRASNCIKCSGEISCNFRFHYTGSYYVSYNGFLGYAFVSACDLETTIICGL